MGVSYGIDLGKLEICFGGFSPTLLGDALATGRSIDENAQRIRDRRAAHERAAALQAARESIEHRFTDGESTTWVYVLIDDSVARLSRCIPGPDVTHLVVPGSLEGKPVVALGVESLSSLEGIQSIAVPDSVVSIGACAFRQCEDMRAVILPASLGEFRSDWFRACHGLEELTLPGALPVLRSDIFDIPHLRTLHIGAGTESIMPNAFAKSALEEMTIASDNPFMMTDGQAIYNADGTVMAALAIPTERYRIREGCRALGNKALSTMGCVSQVDCPDSLEVIGNFAFAKTGITSFIAPPHLAVIMEKAFFDCQSLATVILNGGLKVIERNAFTSTAITELTLPASVEQLGYPIAARTALVYSGYAPTFRIAPEAQSIFMDEHGGLYREADDGLHLIYMLDEGTTHYEVAPGTAAIEAGAFAGHPSIERVAIPSSVRTIGKGAFKDAQALTEVVLGEGLETIAKEAFLNTSLASIRIPSTVRSIEENALVTSGSRHGQKPPTLHDIQVAPDNPRFFEGAGLLLERKNERTSRVVLSADDRARVVIPPEVDEIASYAFNGDVQLQELVLSDRISTVGIRGLAVGTHVELLHIDLVKPIEGHAFFELRFPPTTRGIQQQHLALSTSAFINVEALFGNYDNAIVNASGFDAMVEDGFDLYEQAKKVIERLKDPVFLSEANRALCERVLSRDVEQVTVAFAKHDDRRAIDDLVDMGYLNEDNILNVIDRVGAVQDASITGYLLELNHRRFAAFDGDFEL